MTLPFSHLGSLTTRPLLTGTGASYSFPGVSHQRHMERHPRRISRCVSGGRPFNNDDQCSQGHSPTFLPLIWNQKQDEKKNPQKSVSCCQALPKLLSLVVSFPRIEYLLTPVKALTLPTCLWLDGRPPQGLNLCRLPGPGMPEAAAGCKIPCLAPASSVPSHRRSRVLAASPGSLHVWNLAPGSLREQEAAQAKLGSVPSVSGFCLASWLCC